MVLEEGLFNTKAVNEEEEGSGGRGCLLKTNAVNMVDTEQGFVSMLLHRDPRPFLLADPLQKYFLERFARKKKGQVPSEILRYYDLQMAKAW